jgi:hypothetical protein
MNNVKIFVSEFFNIHKKDFFLVILINIFAGSILNSGYDIHVLIFSIAIILVALKNFSFIRQSVIMPSVSSDFDRFSWKYFMGLPLSKKEITQSLVITNTITLIPFSIGLICFLPQVIAVSDLKESDITLAFVIKSLIAGITFFVLTSISSIKGIITLPRRQYSRLPPKIQYLQGVKKILLYIVIGMYSIIILDIFLKEMTISLSFLKAPVKFIIDHFQVWMFLPIAVYLIVHAYKNLLNTWQDEKASYYKKTWNSKRDVPVCLASVFAIILPTMFCDFEMPSKYGNDPLQAAVFHNEIQEASTLINQNKNIHVRSKAGYTPILIAAKEGHLKMFQLLVEKGANLHDKINIGQSKGDNVLHLAVLSNNENLVRYILDRGISPNENEKENKVTPLHLAARACNPRMVDLLIQKKANINSVDILNRSALHYAANTRRCFPTLAALIDGGIDPLILDKNQKTAFDLSLKKDKESSYYLEKKTRMPASAKAAD